MKKKGKIFLCLLILVCLCIFIIAHRERCISWAKEAAIKIIINNSESSLKPVESNGMLFVPLTFPVEEGKGTWQVSVEYSKDTGTVKIQKTKIKEKYREKTKCSRCSGTKKCQACYPAGSGQNASGSTCSICDGNGKCFYCNGEGEY